MADISFSNDETIPYEDPEDLARSSLELSLMRENDALRKSLAEKSQIIIEQNAMVDLLRKELLEARIGRPNSAGAPNIENDEEVRVESLERAMEAIRLTDESDVSENEQENHAEPLEESSDESGLDPGEYEVEEIVNRRLLKDRPKTNGRPKNEHYEYEVAWVGYPPEYNLWKKFDDLKITCNEKLTEFLRRRAGKTRTKK